MAGLVMLSLIGLMVVTLVVMAVMRKGWKRILQTLLSFIGAIVLLNYYVVKTCGPNSKDVELMTPQAEVITKYILKNGIPKFMADIPNLPYKLENCNREIWYPKRIDEVIEAKCVFIANDRTYDVSIRFAANYKQQYINDLSINILNSETLRSGGGDLTFYNQETETGMDYNYEFDGENKKWVYDYFYVRGKRNNPQIYSTKNDGICNPMRM